MPKPAAARIPATMRRVKRPLPTRPVLACSAVIIVLVPAAGVALSAAGQPPAIDLWWRSVVVAGRSEPLTEIALVLDEWGAHGLGFGVVPALLAGVMLLTGRARALPGLVVAGGVSLALVQTLKPILERTRPDDMLTLSDVGSFPSGHVANIATLFVFAALVYGRPGVTMLAVGCTVVMAWSRTYLSAHWLTDTLAGALLGAAVATAVFSAGPALYVWLRRPRST